MTDTVNITLDKLVAWEGNVRKTATDSGLEELAASIAAHGLLQSLVVRKHGKSKYAVVAGGRRLQALQRLAASGAIGKDAPVPCQILAAETDATEISLAENTVREQMHPADEFEAFRELADKGIPPADIAARFGVTETVVLKRLKLARVSPVILAAYRKDDLTMEQVMAFAVSDDHEAQERLLEHLPPWNADPECIRDALTEHEISATDRRVKFATLKAYEKAGGKTRRDLFAEDGHGIFILDPALLDSLVMKKLEKTATAIRKEGWKWVEIRPSYDYTEWSKCERRFEEAAPLPADQQQEYEALREEYNGMIDTNDETDPQVTSRLDEIEARMNELDDRATMWPPETLAIAGAVVSIGHKGEADIHRGFVLPEDKPKKQAKPATATTTDAEGNVTTVETESASPHSAALIESLTAHRSAALKAALAVNPEIGLAAAVHAIADGMFYKDGRAGTCLQTSAQKQYHPLAKQSPANDELDREESLWRDRIPGEEQHFWQWCLKQDRDTLIGLLTYCVALSIDATQRKADKPDCGRLQHADLLARALKLDMANYFRPDAENYFGRVSKAAILQALQEAKGTPLSPATAKLSKTELAAQAARTVAGTGWLPVPLRKAG